MFFINWARIAKRKQYIESILIKWIKKIEGKYKLEFFEKIKHMISLEKFALRLNEITISHELHFALNRLRTNPEDNIIIQRRNPQDFNPKIAKEKANTLWKTTLLLKGFQRWFHYYSVLHSLF